MSKYEATSPVTLTAGETVASGLRGRGAKINAAGQVVRCTAASDLVIGIFSQDAMATGEPVTVDQLQGKVSVVAAVAITRGYYVVLSGAAGGFGSAETFAGLANDNICVGVALETASAGEFAQVLAAPIGAKS